MPALLRLVWATAARQAGDVSSLGRHGAAAAVARSWQNGATPEVCGDFLARFLTLAEAGDVDAATSYEIQAACEAAAVPGTEGAVPALRVAALAALRGDVPSLAGLSGSEALHTLVRQGLAGGSSALEEAAWAVAAAASLSAMLRLGGERAGALMFTGRACVTSWPSALRHTSVWVRSDAAIMLASACFGRHDQFSCTTTVEELPPVSELLPLSVACAGNLAAGACRILRDAHCLLLVAMLTLPDYPSVARARVLHDASQQPVLAALFGDGSGSSEGGAGAPCWATAPVLLYVLLMLRSRPPWLEPQILVPHAAALARLARAPREFGPCRLLALRILEELLVLPHGLPPYQEAVVQQVLEDGSTWAEAARSGPLRVPTRGRGAEEAALSSLARGPLEADAFVRLVIAGLLEHLCTGLSALGGART